jgi:hypothetical protein
VLAIGEAPLLKLSREATRDLTHRCMWITERWSSSLATTLQTVAGDTIVLIEGNDATTIARLYQHQDGDHRDGHQERRAPTLDGLKISLVIVQL